MEKHKHYRSTTSGFTIIEVVLVLAISMLLFVSIIGTTAVNITRQRYNDSVQSFSEFLRRQYAEVLAVENPRGLLGSAEKEVLCTVNSNYKISTTGLAGRSNCLIYGRLIVIGEDSNNYNHINIYDVIGDDASASASLADLSLDALTRKFTSGSCQYQLAGNSYGYNLEWGATIKTTDNKNYTGSILIVRQPSGNVVTLHLEDDNKALAVQQTIGKSAGSYNENNCKNPEKKITSGSSYNQLISKKIKDNKFVSGEINMCIASEDILSLGNKRRMVRITSPGSNSSAVSVINQDSEYNTCQS